LIDHVVTLAVDERPPDQKPTGDERAHLADQLRTSWFAKCGDMTSKGYDCALAARSLGDIDRCGS
jgi:hypothetical protein